MEIKLLQKHIYELEKQLLLPQIRNSKENLSELIYDEFFEFCSSGSIYFYDKDTTQNDLQDFTGLKVQIENFEIKTLSPEVILATYKIIKYNKATRETQYSLRSSIWKCFDTKWKIVFHQGTLITGA